MKVILDTFFSRFTPAYVESRKSELTQLAQLVAVEDFDAIESEFHKIRGSGGGFGLVAISDLARGVENAAQGRQAVLVEAAFLSYQDYIQALEVEFQESEK